MFKKVKYLAVAFVMTWSFVAVPAAPVQASSIRPIVYTNGLDGHVISINPDGSDRRDYGPGFYPKPSPDGSKIAFARDNTDYSARDLYVIDRDGSNLRKVSERIYTPGSSALFFSWSPDGSKLTFTIESGATDPATGSISKQIATAKLDGSERKQLTNDSDSINNSNPVWSPDGKHILYQRNADLYIMKANGNNQRMVIAGATDGSWAPSSDKILFTETGVGVRTAATDGTNRVTLSAIGSNARWSPDGSKIVMQAPNCDCASDPLSIILFNPNGSGKSILASPPSAGTVQQPVWSPDSARVAFVEFASRQPAQLVSKSVGGGDATIIITERVGYPEWAYLSKSSTTPPPHDVPFWHKLAGVIYHWLAKLWP